MISRQLEVLWSDETKIITGINSTHQLAVFGGGGMLPMTPRTPSPPSNMEVETLFFMLIMLSLPGVIPELL